MKKNTYKSEIIFILILVSVFLIPKCITSINYLNSKYKITSTIKEQTKDALDRQSVISQKAIEKIFNTLEKTNRTIKYSVSGFMMILVLMRPVLGIVKLMESIINICRDIIKSLKGITEEKRNE